MSTEPLRAAKRGRKHANTQKRILPVQSPPPEAPREIKIGREPVPAEVDGRMTTTELFTMTLGTETIWLQPLKTWSQLDV
jgi:hypothetical protein